MKRELPTRKQVAVLVAAVTVVTGAAIAQQAVTSSEVRVQASGVIKKQAGKSGAGVPIETAQITMLVGYGDLSLETNSGQTLLRDRIADAAKDACARISATYALGTPGTSDSPCVNAAINDAKSQVDAAIAAANNRRTGAH
jgi:UrcA family protein